MIKFKQYISYQPNGSFDVTLWLESMKATHQLDNVTVLQQAIEFILYFAKGLTTFYGQSYLDLGLKTAEVLLSLKLNQQTAAAGIISNIELTPSIEEKIKKQFDANTAKLILGVKQTKLISDLSINKNHLQTDKIRKMLLTMASDIRVVLIKLAERLCFMYGIKHINATDRKKYAQEILDIYAPLANRLGIGQLKWELEDIAFHYLNPIIYKTIANFLAERRVDREKRIQNLVKNLSEKLATAEISGEVTGRAKHIYSIYLKSLRKGFNYESIYDYSAIRILVHTIEDCYKALSLVHSLWSPIIKEFDDYIASPKSNGYQSIHTAVLGEDAKHFEIQIRTYDMHEASEHGVAAHWVYKENKITMDDKAKIAYLRQLLDWQKAVTESNKLEKTNADLLDTLHEQIYVITPAGDILDLPKGSTPIDFAYHIHSELGHRCRGAKINGQIVPLNHPLQTGDKVEVIVIQHGNPSRDWLNPELAYIKTVRAKSKINHWFKQQALNKDIQLGRELLERELARHAILKNTSLHTIAKHFQFKNEENLLSSIARGNIRLGQIMQFLLPKTNETPLIAINQVETHVVTDKNYGKAIVGANDFMTRIAQCCKPIPGDEILGYITQGRGISIHKKNCSNIKNLINPIHQKKLIDIAWEEKNADMFSADLNIIAIENNKILQDLTALFTNEKAQLLRLNSTLNQSQQKMFITATVQILDKQHLQRLMHRIRQLAHVIEVK